MLVIRMLSYRIDEIFVEIFVLDSDIVPFVV